MLRSALLATLRAWAAIRGTQPPYGVVRVRFLPELLRPYTVYLIGEVHHRWFAAMDCPCGCSSVVQLSILTTGRPRWTVAEHWTGTVTIHPSIQRTTGCRSHYFVRRGRILWVPVLATSMTS
ncbi:MAG: DUF6527 family protein [Myxococcota bacterium]